MHATASFVTTLLSHKIQITFSDLDLVMWVNTDVSADVGVRNDCTRRCCRGDLVGEVMVKQ